MNIQKIDEFLTLNPSMLGQIKPQDINHKEFYNQVPQPNWQSLKEHLELTKVTEIIVDSDEDIDPNLFPEKDNENCWAQPSSDENDFWTNRETILNKISPEWKEHLWDDLDGPVKGENVNDLE
jgi:hypothetical protein